MILTYLSAIILIFGGGFSWYFVGEHSKNFTMPFEFSIFYRQFLAGVFLVIIALLKRSNFKITKEQFKLCLFVTLFYYIIYYFAAYKASIYLIPAIVSFISATKILFVECILSVMQRRRPSGRIIVASIFAVFGIVVLSKANMNISHLKLNDIIVGLLIAFLAPIGNSISNVAIDLSPAKKSIDNFVMASYCWLMSSVFFLFLGLFNNNWNMPPIPLDKNYLIALTYLSFVSSGITMVCVYYLIDKLGSITTTYMSIAHAPTAMILCVLFKGYKLDLKSVAGLSLCIFSLYISNTYSLKKARYKKISDDRKRRFSKNIKIN